jgi:hypothetical protein
VRPEASTVHVAVVHVDVAVAVNDHLNVFGPALS